MTDEDKEKLRQRQVVFQHIMSNEWKEYTAQIPPDESPTPRGFCKQKGEGELWQQE